MRAEQPRQSRSAARSKRSKPGLHFDDNKLPLELLPNSLFRAVAAILDHGRKKYAPRNWEKGIAWGRIYASLLRHLIGDRNHKGWWDGENVDRESGLPHLWHAACDLAFLIEYAETHPEFDDRPTRPERRKRSGS